MGLIYKYSVFSFDFFSTMDLPIQETNQNSNFNSNSNLGDNKNKLLFITLLNQNRKWSEMALHSLLVLSGQSAATILGRLYYEKGGKSKYLGALMQTAGFPILLPLIFIRSRNNHTPSSSSSSSSSSSTLALPALYICFGTFLAFDCILYSIGLMHLPLSTFSLLCSTQLAFNAFFSFFINSHKLTPSILNSILLLTLSSILLALQLPDSSREAAAGRYALGVVCTLSGTAAYALLLSVEQLAYGKLMKRQTMNGILIVIFFECMAASCVLVLGLLWSGEWRGLKEEMEGFGLGEAAYVAVVVGVAVGWQVFSVGMVSLILKVSSLFGNVVSSVGVPVVPILAVVVFKDKMYGVKVVALLLAFWGCVSYVYQQFLDHDCESKGGNIANVDCSIGD